MDMDEGATGSLTYAPNVSESYTLLELSEDLLKDIYDGKLLIKSTADGEAVLCSSDRTFTMHKLDTSNLLCLIPPPSSSYSRNSGDKRVIVATASAHIECRDAAPLVDELRHLLEQNVYTKDHLDSDQCGMQVDQNTQNLGKAEDYTWAKLLEKIPMSESELQTALQNLGAVDVDGSYMLLEPVVVSEIIQLFLLVIQENGWSYNNIPLDKALEGLGKSGIKDPLGRHVVHQVTTQTPGTMATFGGTRSEEETGHHHVRLDSNLVVALIGYALLWGSTGRRMKLGDFTTRWAARLPQELTLQMERIPSEHDAMTALDARRLLRGMALVKVASLPGGGDHAEEVITVMNARMMTSDPAARFKMMFAEQERWTLEELEPYLADLHIPGKTKDEVLLLYARETKGRGGAPDTYSARYSFM